MSDSHPFVTGGRYCNSIGFFEVLSIANPDMTVRYDNGETATVSIAIQTRIYQRINRTEPDTSTRSSGRGTSSHIPLISTELWWVNQGVSYARELESGVLWAPTTDVRGHPLPHHETMRYLRPGHRILHYAGQEIKSVGTVLEPHFLADRRPYSLGGRYESYHGYVARIAYTALLSPIPINMIPVNWRIAERTAFNKNGSPNLGYLYPISHSFARQLVGAFPGQLGDLLALG